MSTDWEAPVNEGANNEVVPTGRAKRRSGYVISRVLDHPLVKAFGKNGALNKTQIGFVSLSIALALEEEHERERSRDAFKLLSFTWLTDRMSRSRGESVIVVNGSATSTGTDEKKSKGPWDLASWSALAALMGVAILGFATWSTYEAASWKSVAEARNQTIADLRQDKKDLKDDNADLQADIRELDKAAGIAIGTMQKEEDKKAFAEQVAKIVKKAIKSDQTNVKASTAFPAPSKSAEPTTVAGTR